MIGYTTLGTDDLQRAMAFYDALFASVGIARLMELPHLAGWGVDWNKPMFGIARPFDGKAAVPGNGVMVALCQTARHYVDTLHARAIELGATSEGAPGVRGADGSQAFYGAYVRDLDGNKLCFYCIGPGDAGTD